MNNFEEFQELVRQYFEKFDCDITFMSTLKDCSLNDSDGNQSYLYQGRNLPAIDMDAIAKNGYKLIKAADLAQNPINTVDAFMIDGTNNWYLIEFKDSPIKEDKTKNSVLKKAYSNWYMILDILYEMREYGIFNKFDFLNPVLFAKMHVHYILICREEKNPQVYRQIKNHALLNARYTPPFMQRLKDYLFKEVYVYTEDYFEREFVEVFDFDGKAALELPRRLPILTQFHV